MSRYNVIPALILAVAMAGIGCSAQHRGGLLPTTARATGVLASKVTPRVVQQPVKAVAVKVVAPAAKATAPVTVPVAKATAVVVKEVVPPAIISHPVKVMLVGHKPKETLSPRQKGKLKPKPQKAGA